MGSKTIHIGDEVGKHEYTVKNNYLTGGSGDNSRSPLVSQIEEKGLVLQYEYDVVGNITMETRTPKDGEPVSISYAYDKLGQLTRVDDPTDVQAYDEGTTWVYEYDLGGNILRKRGYPYTDPGVTINTAANPGAVCEYSYGSAQWRDQMTDYNGLPVTYDPIGNPLSYDGWTYEWKAGRKLVGMKKQSYDPSQFPTWDQTYPKGDNWEDAETLLQLMVEYTPGAITAKVYENGIDVTDTFPESNFSWRRQSGDQIADIRWNQNEANLKGKKILTVGASDIETSAVIVYQFQDEVLGVKLELPMMLKSISNGYAKQIQYSYDAAGLRTQKVVNSSGVITTTNYFLHGKLLTHMTASTGTTTDKLHFYYDAQSRPQMVKFNGQYYSYQHNLQGDIIGIIDSTGTKVVEYGYGAWGKPLSTTGSMASTLGKLSLFRYRGYVYDEETGLYYLRSRYYNPTWGRFLNEDVMIGTGALLSHNMLAYCSNRPIVSADSSGLSGYVIAEDLSDDLVVHYGVMVLRCADVFGVSPERYTEILDDYDVESKPKSKLCNEVVSDLGNLAIGDSAVFRAPNITAMVKKFDGWAETDGGKMDYKKRKWLEVDSFDEARIWANAGFFTLALWRNPEPEDGNTGHGQVIGPSKTADKACWQGNKTYAAGPLMNKNESIYRIRYFISLRALI